MNAKNVFVLSLFPVAAIAAAFSGSAWADLCPVGGCKKPMIEISATDASMLIPTDKEAMNWLGFGSVSATYSSILRGSTGTFTDQRFANLKVETTVLALHEEALYGTGTAEIMVLPLMAQVRVALDSKERLQDQEYLRELRAGLVRFVVADIGQSWAVQLGSYVHKKYDLGMGVSNAIEFANFSLDQAILSKSVAGQTLTLWVRVNAAAGIGRYASNLPQFAALRSAAGMGSSDPEGRLYFAYLEGKAAVSLTVGEKIMMELAGYADYRGHGGDWKDPNRFYTESLSHAAFEATLRYTPWKWTTFVGGIRDDLFVADQSMSSAGHDLGDASVSRQAVQAFLGLEVRW